MSTWTSGYVADVGYTFGFYRDLTPGLLTLAALSRGQRAPQPSDPITYCELGCGQGFTANLLAAANPHIEVYATDFNPAHIAGARSLAMRGGLKNVHFSESSFQDYVEDPGLPDFDMVVLHGIYSWVNDEARAAIVAFLRRKLKPGGLVFISYNTMPGWAAAAPMRHLLRLQTEALAGPTEGKLTEALGFISKLKGANAGYFRLNPGMGERFDRLQAMPSNYLAHEYLNESWKLFYHSDVVQELYEAKLSFLVSSNLLDGIDAINLTDDQKALLAETKDPSLRETVRDFIVNQQFRRDIFVKGATSLSPMALQRQWLDRRFVLSERRADVPMVVRGALGEGGLQAQIYDPLLEALAQGPKTVEQLLEATGLPMSRLQEALLVLTGNNVLQPCLEAAGDAARASRTKAFNTVVMEEAQSAATLPALASPITGGGVFVSRFPLLFLLAAERDVQPVQFAWDTLRAHQQSILRDGKGLETPEENVAAIQALYDTFLEKQLPALRQLGIA